MSISIVCHSERSEESSNAPGSVIRTGFFAALRMTRWAGLLLAGLLFLPGAFAQTKAPATPEVIYPRVAEASPAVASRSSSGFNSVLLAALVLAAAGGWLFWRARTAPGGAALLRKLAIVETKSLGNRQYLVVAGYEDKKFLLGVCPGRIDLLTPLEGRPPADGSS